MSAIQGCQKTQNHQKIPKSPKITKITKNDPKAQKFPKIAKNDPKSPNITNMTKNHQNYQKCSRDILETKYYHYRDPKFLKFWASYNNKITTSFLLAKI